MTQCLHVRITGRVQGVGFRYATHDKARALELNGWVRNTSDGCVEAEFEGERPVLEQMLAWCHVGPRSALVTEVDATWESREPSYQGFRMRVW